MATDNSSHNNPEGGGATGTVERSSQKPSEKMTTLNAADESIDPQEYARLLDLYDNSFRNIAEGEVVKGTVLKVTPSEVIVDVGYKSEGIIPVDENRTRPHNGYWYSNADVALYDGIARDVAAGEGALHIDFARAFGTPEAPYRLTRQDLLADGIHPNAAGHQGMFASARAALHEWLGL